MNLRLKKAISFFIFLTLLSGCATSQESSYRNDGKSQVGESDIEKNNLIRAYQKKIISNWVPPENSNGMSTKAYISLNDKGEIESYYITPSGSVIFDKSVEAAINSSAPFNLPVDEYWHNRSKKLIINFISKKGSHKNESLAQAAKLPTVPLSFSKIKDLNSPNDEVLVNEPLSLTAKLLVIPPTFSNINDVDIPSNEVLIVARIYLDTLGKISTVELESSSGSEVLDRKIINGLQQSKFRPYIENGKAVPVFFKWPVNISKSNFISK
jgi:hypothetical protein